MGFLIFGVWVAASVVSLVKGKHTLVLASVVGGIVSGVVGLGIALSAAFGGEVDRGSEIAASIATLGMFTAFAAPIWGALRMAKPWSLWARRYDTAKLRLATGRFLNEADRRRWEMPEEPADTPVQPDADGNLELVAIG